MRTTKRGLVAAVVACTLASVASGAAASSKAARAVTAACASFRDVDEVKGHATLTYQESATGVDTSENGMETISLDRRSLVTLNLNERDTFWYGFAYFGHAIVSDAAVNDTFANTGTGYYGAEHFDGHATAIGALYVESAANRCRYTLDVSVNATTAFSGDPQVRPTDETTIQTADSGWLPIQHPIYLSASLTAVPRNDHCVHLGQVCYRYQGGWADDFTTLLQCGSVEFGNCQPGKNATDESVRAHLNLQLRAYFKRS